MAWQRSAPKNDTASDAPVVFAVRPAAPHDAGEWCRVTALAARDVYGCVYVETNGGGLGAAAQSVPNWVRAWPDTR